MEEIESQWYDRVKRINYDNIFIMMYTENREISEQFSQLPWKKKVRFTPFESSHVCVYSIMIICSII